MVADDNLPADEVRPVPKGYRQFITEADDRAAGEAGKDIRRLIRADTMSSRLQPILTSPLLVFLALCAAALGAEFVVRSVSQDSRDQSSRSQTGQRERIGLPDAGVPPLLLPDPTGLAGDVPVLDAAPATGAASLEAPPALAVPPPQGEPVLAAPPPPAGMEGPAPAKAKGETLIFEAPVSGEEGQSDGAGGKGGGPVVIGVRTRPPAAALARGALTAGTVLPAVLETVVDTATPGSVRAVVSSEVRTSDGSRVLVPRLSRLEGQYRSANESGRKRAMIVWTRMVRPDGSSSRLGTASAAGKAFSEQFGAASLVSVVSGGAGGDIRVRPGEPIRVTTARSITLESDSR